MGKYKFGIASYQRKDKQFLLSYLNGLGYDAEDIILSTQDEHDFRQYEELFGDKATIIYKRGENVCDNKNNLVEWYNAHYGAENDLIVCSDKVKAVEYLGKDGKLRPMNRKQLDSFLARAFEVARSLKASIFGPYTVGNAFFMSHSTHINQFLLGCFMGIVDTQSVVFDRQQPLKEDWEIILRTIASGGRVVRFNDIALDATFRTKGGSYKMWNTEGKNKQCTDRLLMMYPDLIKPHPTRENELKYIGYTKKINKSIIYG